MYIKRKEDVVLGFGQMGEDKMIAHIGEFDYEDNVLLKKLSFQVYEDVDTKELLYVYKDKLLTFKELRSVYLKEYYGVE